MSLSILTLADELKIIKCMLTYDRDPLAMLGMRQHFADYHLDPLAPDAFFLGSIQGDIVDKMLTVTIRGSETVIRKPLANITDDDMLEAICFCKQNAETRNYLPIINVILSTPDHARLMSDFSLPGVTVTSTPLKAGDRLANKSQWLNVMNRNALSYDAVFTVLEF